MAVIPSTGIFIVYDYAFLNPQYNQWRSTTLLLNILLYLHYFLQKDHLFQNVYLGCQNHSISKFGRPTLKFCWIYDFEQAQVNKTIFVTFLLDRNFHSSKISRARLEINVIFSLRINLLFVYDSHAYTS